MTPQDITLNIAVNLGRLARWASDGKTQRLTQFLLETEEYIKQLENASVSSKFQPTLMTFKKKFIELKNSSHYNNEWAEDALTWANILTHRAKLA